MSAASRPLPARQQTFVFEATQACNHDCPHCYNAWKNPVDYPMGQLGTADTLAMLGRMLDETGASHVTLSGGEPLLRCDLFEIITFLRGRNIAINLISNGSLLDELRLPPLVNGTISMFELPLLSCDRAIHDRLSGRDGAFDDVTMAIARLKSHRQRVVCVFVATKLNLHTWRETAELAIALGADGIMFNRFNPGGRGAANIELLQADPAELSDALAIADDIARTYDYPIACSIAMPRCLFDASRYPRLAFGFCAAGTERAYYTLDPLGNVRPCNHSPRILGNIRTQPFAEMIGGPAMRQFMNARPEFCAGCLHEWTCQGGCKAAAEACHGCPSLPDPLLAAYCGQAHKPSHFAQVPASCVQ